MCCSGATIRGGALECKRCRFGYLRQPLSVTILKQSTVQLTSQPKWTHLKDLIGFPARAGCDTVSLVKNSINHLHLKDVAYRHVWP